RHADAVICVNDEQKGQLRGMGMGEEDVFVLPNMVTFTPEHRALRVSYARQTPPVVGVLSRLVPAKGVDVFLEALKRLVERDVPVRARIAGDGSERAALQRLARELGLSNRVEFLGWVKERDTFYDS